VIQFERKAMPVPTEQSQINAFADALRDNPGEWALYGYAVSSASARMHAYLIRRGGERGDGGWNPRIKEAFGSERSFETHSVTLFGENRIYIRYVGVGNGD
jgi:hypothetical protein